jgi:tetratricopeptide (TPR) repeat protein
MKAHNDKKSGKTGPSAPSGPEGETTPAHYLRAMKAHLRGGRQKDAFALLQQASVRYPDDPLILSYYGCLQAIVDKKYRSGVENCKKAIVLLKKKESFEEELLFPVFYLNLGRAFVAARKKKDALNAFHQGLSYDDSNSEILKELRGLGERKPPPVPFLDRSNPVNKYIGMILQKTKKEAGGNRGKS